ncbi:hypothetical protein ELS24_10405 [Achromobacter spanius]|uniref:hypothetical protein n=1 Tax=Achromobacter spanius TaxID=217203 RepID=UPI000F8F82C6|nr:hypothetical protein [Achromobacter spanius]AZS78819.1 hypothetical protein ELS24_10405 [Achromobacter spanius]
MSGHRFNQVAEFTGPGGCTVEGLISIEFEYHKADPSVGVAHSITVEHIVIVIGTDSYEFDGDYHAADIVDACWLQLRYERERAECDHADMLRDERGAQ